MQKAKTSFVCTECGYEVSKWLGRCPSCGQFNKMEETIARPASVVKNAKLIVPGAGKPTLLGDVDAEGNGGRLPTDISELDRVLSGGIVEGSLLLLGGDPGIGKSTLLLQICDRMGSRGLKILYVSGEESVNQIKLRAARLSVAAGSVYLLAETCMETIINAIDSVKPSLVMIDSIQTMAGETSPSMPGSVTQVRECTAALMRVAKQTGASIIIVGHVTKEGAIAGPRVLEHMVDTVLYFEGERRESYRVIRAVKNRFGATNEIGVFEMREKGLCAIDNPSAYMLDGRPKDVSGSAVTCALEGTRPILTEVQALVNFTSFGTPRRTATGMDHNRIAMLIAVLEKRAGYKLSSCDSYVNVAGGMKIEETAADAAAIAALASCYKDKPIASDFIFFGEVGLTGEIRSVNMAEKRVTEAQKMGFTQCVMPQSCRKAVRPPEGMRIYTASHIGELLDLII